MKVSLKVSLPAVFFAACQGTTAMLLAGCQAASSVPSPPVATLESTGVSAQNMWRRRDRHDSEEWSERKYVLTKFKGGLLNFKQLPNSPKFLVTFPYAASKTRARANLLAANFDYYDWFPAPPAYYAVDWYGNVCVNNELTFGNASLEGTITSHALDGSTQYFLIEFMYTYPSSWTTIGTVALGRPVSGGLTFATPFENGFYLPYCSVASFEAMLVHFQTSPGR